MSDRIKIMRKAAWPDINIAPQVLISCQTTDFGCHGGDPINAFDYISEFNITDETCAIYRARGYDNGVECSPLLRCKNCNPHEECFIPDTFHEYTVDEYDVLIGEEDMMQEIFQRGPITCSIATPAALFNYTEGIFNDTTGAYFLDHSISIVGWGEENGVKYWHMRNSWGHTWGQEGFAKIIKGINNLGIEEACAWGTPVDTWTDNYKHVTT